VAGGAPKLTCSTSAQNIQNGCLGSPLKESRRPRRVVGTIGAGGQRTISRAQVRSSGIIVAIGPVRQHRAIEWCPAMQKINKEAESKEER
jgi:hypothetical protein